MKQSYDYAKNLKKIDGSIFQRQINLNDAYRNLCFYSIENKQLGI